MAVIKAVFLDISGVLYDGDHVIEGAVATIEKLRKSNLTLRFVTNTATQSLQQIHHKLVSMGFHVAEDEIFTAPLACQALLKQQKLNPYLLVHPSVLPLFAEFNCTKPNAVVIGDSREQFDYAHLNQAFKYCLQGAPLIAIAKNRYFKDGGELQLDSGAFVKAIEWSAGVQSVITGKPAKTFFDMAVASTGFATSECLMVGDDVLSDVNGAINAGLQGVLVQTGKFREGDRELLNESGKCIGSVNELVPRYCH